MPKEEIQEVIMNRLARHAAGRKLSGRVAFKARLLGLVLLFGGASVTPILAQATKLQQSQQILSLTGPADDHEHDSIGSAAAISKNGNTMILGAVNGNGVVEGTGVAYIFDKINGEWVETAKLFADDGTATPEPQGKFANDSFGVAAAISEDGDTAIVGAPAHAHEKGNDNSGAVYVYQRVNGVWSQQAELRSRFPNGRDFFGAGQGFGGIGISENTIVVTDQGNGQFLDLARGIGVDVFTYNNGVWAFTTQLTVPDDGFFLPTSVAIDRNTVIVGSSQSDSPIASESGVAYVFRFNAGQWSAPVTLAPADATFFGAFGSSVSISGNTVAIGAITQPGLTGQCGAAYVFAHEEEEEDGVWSQKAKLIASDGQDFDNFGFSISISGQTVLVGANDKIQPPASALASGAAYVFRQSDGIWRQIAELAVASEGLGPDINGIIQGGGDFGSAVAVEHNTLLVGADVQRPAFEGYAAGEAYVYRLNPQD
jgi:hypothetical protein